MTEFYLVLFAVALVVLFFVVGWAIDNYRELVRLRKTYDTKAEQSVIIYEAMLSLIREFNKEELKIYREKYSEILSGLYETPEDNEGLIEIYELLVEEIELRLSSLDEDERSSGGITVEA